MAHVTGNEAADIIVAVGEVLAVFGVAPLAGALAVARPIAKLVKAAIDVTRKREDDDFDNSQDGGVI